MTRISLQMCARLVELRRGLVELRREETADRLLPTADYVSLFDEAPRGQWAQTASGRMFYPLDPRPEEIFIEDIADGLARLCRYGGQIRRDVEHYSVAEHSVCLARYFAARGERALARWALLHDAGELFGEMIRPIKSATPDYRAIEARIMAAVCDRFGLPRDEPREVKQADLRILLDERDAVMATPPAPWDVDGLEPLGAVILCYSQAMARAAFLHWFWELFPEERAYPRFGGAAARPTPALRADPPPQGEGECVDWRHQGVYWPADPPPQGEGECPDCR